MDQNTKDKLVQEQLERAGAFEELIRTKGWDFILARYKNELAGFVNELITSEEPIGAFEAKRQRLKGLKVIIGEVDNDLRVLAEYRKNENNSGSK